MGEMVLTGFVRTARFVMQDVDSCYLPSRTPTVDQMLGGGGGLILSFCQDAVLFHGVS